MHENTQAAEHKDEHLDPPEAGNVTRISQLHHKITTQPKQQ